MTNATMIKTAAPISRQPLNEKDFSTKYADRVRHGKTKKDHDNGAHKRNAERKAARAAWQQDKRAGHETFPL